MKLFVVIKVANGRNEIPIIDTDELERLTERLEKAGVNYDLDYRTVEVK